MIVLLGMGGIGKSTLAIRATQLCRPRETKLESTNPQALKRVVPKPPPFPHPPIPPPTHRPIHPLPPTPQPTSSPSSRLSTPTSLATISLTCLSGRPTCRAIPCTRSTFLGATSAVLSSLKTWAISWLPPFVPR
jgi:hypothetical protein